MKENTLIETLDARSIVSLGNGSRLAHVFSKASHGNEITVGIIGGSITQGAVASPGNDYGSLVAVWWKKTYPDIKVNFINAGIGATGSNYGVLRAPRDLLPSKPDVVIVEYAVNDLGAQKPSETLEGLVRQILKQPNQPAVILLFMVEQSGDSMQDHFVEIGSHYDLPMVSYRDALWPELEAGRIQWTEISPDTVHPNDRGHAYVARWINKVLQHHLDSIEVGSLMPAIQNATKPLFSDDFEFTDLRESAELKPVSNKGWSYDARNQSWDSRKPGSSIVFEISGRIILAMYYVIRGPMGIVRITIDGKTTKTLNGWFEGTWGGYRQTNIIGTDLDSGLHRVRFELLSDKSEESTGNEFRILGLGAAGVRSVK